MCAIKVIECCRVCGGTDLRTVMSLGEQSLAGVFPRTQDTKITSGPVDLVKCVAVDGCGLVQLKQSYNAAEMYGASYGYRSGLNANMVYHLEQKVRHILQMNVLRPGDTVIDIGSNDGTTLRAYPAGEYRLVGIDPSGAKFSDFYPEHIQMIPEFFSASSVHRALGGGRAKVITSFSMFYDLEDPVAFACEIERSLDDDGVWVLEQSYLPTMLRMNSFDTICPEHLEYYTLGQIAWIASRAGLRLLDVEFNAVNGGSFSVTVTKQASSLAGNEARIRDVLQEENSSNAGSVEAFGDFVARVEVLRQRLTSFLVDARQRGLRVCGLGASTKGNVLLQYFGIGRDLIESIGEVNPDKFGAFTPGTLIPLVSEDALLATDPDYLLVLPWHFRDFFLSLPKLASRNLVFPLPQFEIVTSVGRDQVAQSP